MAAVVVDLLGVEVERMSLEEVEELRHLGEVGAAMGVGQAYYWKRSSSHHLLNGRSYC